MFRNRFRGQKFKLSAELFLIALALFGIGFFLKLTFELKEDDELTQIDILILELVGKIRVSRFNGAAVDFTALGSTAVIGLVTSFTALFFMMRKNWLSLFQILATVLGAGAFSSLLKHLVGRERPTVIPRLVEVQGLSYPSGHSLGGAAFYCCIALLLNEILHLKRDRIILWILTGITISLIAFSRIYLGVHYPSDVLSGALIGASWAFLLGAFKIRLQNNHAHF